MDPRRPPAPADVPFTGSHAAAVLPFLRTRLPASALVLGSMAPDVPFYLPFDLGMRTHTLVAIGTVDVLIGLLAWSLWHGLLAAPVLATAPTAVRERVAIPGPQRSSGPSPVGARPCWQRCCWR